MRSVMGMGLRITLPLSIVFGGMALLIPQLVVGFFLPQGESAEYARQYLSMVSFGMIITAVDTVYASAMKSSEQTFIPMLADIAAILTNTVLNYGMIFGHLGFPAMGVKGAAIATVISAGVSLSVNAGVSYFLKLPSAAKLKQLLNFDGAFFKKYIRTVFPVILNEGLWAFGYTMYSVFFGRLGDAAIAAQGIYNTVDQLIFVMIYGLMHATAIVVGRSIGAGEKEKAYLYARRLLFAAVCLGIAMGTVMILARYRIVALFGDVSPQAQSLASVFMVYAGLLAWAKAFNCVNVVGVLRSGGDTVFTMLLDVGSIWCFGVPVVGLAALVLRWPVEIVFLCTAVEELPKIIIGLKRMISKKWINDLTHKPSQEAFVQ
jgi:putative MATE family efflux protein